MKPKRILFFLLLVLIVVFVVNRLGSHEKPVFKELGTTTLHHLGKDAYSLKGSVVLYNPSMFQVRLDAVDLKFKIGGQEIGTLNSETPIQMASKESYTYNYEIRFQRNEVTLSEEQMTEMECDGAFASKSIFSNVEVPVHAKVAVQLD